MLNNKYIIPMTLELVNANIPMSIEDIEDIPANIEGMEDIAMSIQGMEDIAMSVEVDPEVAMQVYLIYDGYEPHSAIAGIAVAGKAIAGFLWS